MTTLNFAKTIAVSALLLLSPNLTAQASGDEAYQKAKASFEAGNSSQAAKWLEIAVSQGHMAAKLPLAAMYRDGNGVEINYRRAVNLFMSAANYGYPSAQFSLGAMYRNGEGVELNYPRAIKWYRMAAIQNYAESQNNLGIMYESGRGIKRDITKAYMWFEIAAKNGSTRGANNSQRLGKMLSASELPKAKKLSLKCLASNYKNCG